ncbi:unnamed protein product, partial [Ilex paraguariensis]
MASIRGSLLIHISALFRIVLLFNLTNLSFAADPFANFDLELSYITVSPLAVPQQVIANKLDENLLITWSGVQMRRSSWQDGVLGTNCPIPPKWNWTYQFQVKDQIGSFFYFPSLNFQRAAGGFGSFIITNRNIIPLPFNTPDGDIVIIIGDWYTRNHTALRKSLDAGNDLGMPDGVLINGKGPFRYNSTLVPDGIDYETINVDPGKTYRIRVHNVGVSTCLNFRIQSHNLLLAETEGYYTSQQNYTSIDIHVGQSYSFLVTMDQNASSDYYIVASARKGNWPLPDPPNDVYDTSYALNQAMSIRQNVSASGARPNPQGSFHYGSINVTDDYILKSVPPVMIDGKLKATFNGISFVNPDTPIRLADSFKVKGAYKLDFPTKPMNRTPQIDISIINATYKGFIEVVLQNNDTVVQSFHIDGYSFFVVGMGYGEWTENSRGSYNKWDAISRSTTQVFSGGWTAIMISLDNVGVWNLRAENLDRWYLGQETYMRIINPEDTGNKTELPVPDNALFCGALAHLQKPQETTSSASTVRGYVKLYFTLLMFFT